MLALYIRKQIYIHDNKIRKKLAQTLIVLWLYENIFWIAALIQHDFVLEY